MKTMKMKELELLLSQNSYKNNIPEGGQFELTPFCNLDCKMCYVHLQTPSVKERMLTGEQWISIMKQAIKKGMLQVLLTGGEALLHPDFWMIYDFLVHSGVHVILKSNGILLNKENINRFKKYPPRRIDVSLYGCDKDSYIAITGRDVFDTVIENIKAVKDAGLNLRLSITPSKYMMPWVVEIMELAKTFDVPTSVNNLLMDANEETGREKTEFDLTLDEYEMILRKNMELFPQRQNIEEDEKLYRDIEKRPEVSLKGLACGGGRIVFAVFWDGKMGPCLSYPRKLICEDPIREGFEAAWKKLNQAVSDYEVPNKCHSCDISAACNYCPAQHSKCSYEHKCDESICEFWHMFNKVMEEEDAKQ